MFEHFFVPMFGFVGTIIAAAVVAGGAVAAARVKRKGEKKAIKAQEDAIKKQQDIDLTAEQKRAQEGDRTRYLESRKLFAEENPDLAKAGDEAGRVISDALTADRGQQALDKLYSENIEMDPRVTGLRDSLLQSAQRNLDLGARLGPDFQQELVRAGLEQSAGTGAGVGRAGPVTQRLGLLLGSAGLGLEEARRQQAERAIGLASNVTANRAGILSGLLTAAQQKRIQDVGLGSGVRQLTESLTPSVGLGGADLVKMSLANLQARNDRFLQLGKLSAANAMSNAAQQGAYINAGTQFATSALGAFGGGGGAGGAGGGGFNFGSLFGGGGQQSQAAPGYSVMLPSYTGGAPMNVTPYTQQFGIGYGR